MAIPDNIFTSDTFPYSSYTDINLDWICDALKTQQAEIDQLAGATVDYDDLNDKPSIEGVTLTGNKTLHQLNGATLDDLDTLSDEFYQLGEKLTAKLTNNAILPISDIPYVKGTISSSAANTATNELASIATSNNRAVIGPFQLYKSVYFDCTASAKYKIYKRFSNDSYSNFRDMSSGGAWMWGTHIEGSNPKAFELCNYYILMGYANDANITDLDDLVSNLTITYTDDNPMGLVESKSVQAGTAIPSGVGGTSDKLRLLSYKQLCKEQSFIHCINPFAQIANYTGPDIYNSTSGSFGYGTYLVKAGNECAAMIRDYTGGSEVSIRMVNYTSFADLYADYGLYIESSKFDSKNITGAQIFDPTIMNNSVTAGTNIVSSVYGNGVSLDDNGSIQFAHVPSMQIVGDKAYVFFQCDRSVPLEFAPTTEVDLAIVDLTTMSVTSYTTIAKNGGTYGGLTFNGRCHNPYTVLDGTDIHVLFDGGVSGEQTLCHAVYDTRNSTFTTTKCQIDDDNGNVVDMTLTGFNRFISNVFGVMRVTDEIIPCEAVPYSGVYIIALSSGNTEVVRKIPLLWSADMTTWQVFYVLDVENGSHCETALLEDNDVLYIAQRHIYDDCTQRVLKLDLQNMKILDYIQIPAVGSRPTLFKQDSVVFCTCPLMGRRVIQFIQANASALGGGLLAATAKENAQFSYNSIKQYNNSLVYAVQSKRKGNTVLTYPQIWVGYSSKLPIQ